MKTKIKSLHIKLLFDMDLNLLLKRKKERKKERKKTLDLGVHRIQQQQK